MESQDESLVICYGGRTTQHFNLLNNNALEIHVVIKIHHFCWWLCITFPCWKHFSSSTWMSHGRVMREQSTVLWSTNGDESPVTYSIRGQNICRTETISQNMCEAKQLGNYISMGNAVWCRLV